MALKVTVKLLRILEIYFVLFGFIIFFSSNSVMQVCFYDGLQFVMLLLQTVTHY
jgi:hypothetical protein